STPVDLISPAAASAPSRSRSAITGMPPRAAKRKAISLPMPLAAPVTIATFPSKRDIAPSQWFCRPSIAAVDRNIEGEDAIRVFRALQDLGMTQSADGVAVA